MRWLSRAGWPLPNWQVLMLYNLVHFVLRIWIRLACCLQVTGRENLPSEGPFLVLSNHLGSMDPLIVVALVPARLRLVGMAASSHRNDFFVGWLMNKCGAIWVRRGEADRRAIRQMVEALESSRVLGMSPEGTRSRTGALIRAKTGAAYIATRANVTLQPVALTGTEKVFLALKRLRRARVTVTYGPPFRLPPRRKESRREHLDYCTELIMARLASMLPPAYRGYYADSPLIVYWEQLDAAGLSSNPAWVDVSELGRSQVLRQSDPLFQ